MRNYLLALCLLPFGVHALERDLLNAIETAGGVYSSIYIHEFGHALVYKTFGATDVSIEVPRKGTILGGRTTADLPERLSEGQRQVVAVSGLVAASLAGEVVLQQRGLHRSPYAQAVLGTAVASNLFHVYTYYTRVRGKEGYTGNDIDYFELAGGNPHLFSVALVSYSAWALHRMRRKSVPFFYVNRRL